MKYARNVLAVTVLVGIASSVSAQTGLYGSPALIPLGSGQPLSYSSPGMPTPLPAAGVHQAPGPYAATPTSYGQSGSGPYLAAAQGYPTHLIQASSEVPPPPAPETVPPPPAPSTALSPIPETPASGAPSVLDQLLQESDGGPGCVGAANCAAEACETECEPCLRCPWYASASGLILTRNMGNTVWTTYRSGNNPEQLMNTEQAKIGWNAGLQFTLGRTFCCDQWALEGTFWGMDAMHGYTSLSPGNGALSTPLDFTDAVFANDPTGVGPLQPDDLFDGADAHFISRTNEVYNVELNLLRRSLQCSETVNIDWLTGVRWFHFRENLLFGSCDAGGSWDDPTTCGYVNERIRNDMLGAQLGLKADWYVGYHLNLFARPKIGIYNNHIESRYDLYGNGQAIIPRPGSGITGGFPVEADKNALAFITEIDLGMDWEFHPQWTATLGYRVFLATNVGLADHQIPTYQMDLPEEASIKDNGSLLMHGAFAGLTYRF